MFFHSKRQQQEKKPYISNLVHTTRFWNNLQAGRLKGKSLEGKTIKQFWEHEYQRALKNSQNRLISHMLEGGETPK
jgi:hypothetical protein